MNYIKEKNWYTQGVSESMDQFCNPCWKFTVEIQAWENNFLSKEEYEWRLKNVSTSARLYHKNRKKNKFY